MISAKAVLITGSTRGLGFSMATVFAKNGYAVILNGRSKNRSTQKSIDKIKKISPNSSIYYFDVASFKKTQTAAKRILRKYSKIEVLINNAGIVRDRTFLKMNDEEWNDVLQTNLHGVFNMTKQILPQMVENQMGRIISISSIIGLKGGFGQSNYAASKAAIIGFTKSLAQEVARYQITVNAIAPGYVKTGMLNKIPNEILDKIVTTIPQRRLANPTEVAELALFLASPKASYITGEVVNINGGLF